MTNDPFHVPGGVYYVQSAIDIRNLQRFLNLGYLEGWKLVTVTESAADDYTIVWDVRGPA